MILRELLPLSILLLRLSSDCRLNIISGQIIIDTKDKTRERKKNNLKLRISKTNEKLEKKGRIKI